MSKLPFTRFTSPRPLSKEYAFIDSKTVKKANVLSFGLAKTIRCSFQSFYNHLINADAYTAFGYGISKHQQIKITSKKSGLADDIHYMTRSKANYQYPDGCGIMMLDYDPSAYSSYQLTFKKFRRILADIHPDLGECACIVRDSVSAGVYLEGQLRSAKGFHVYIPVLDATDIPRFGKLLHQYFWLHGYGYIALSKDGKLFERSPIDVAVFSPERLDFVGEPVVNSPLQYQPPRCQYFPGFYLDTSVLKSKSLNQKRVDQIIQQAKKQIRPQQQQVQHEYDHQQVLRLVERGHSAKEAEAIVARNRANDYQFLDESHTLYFSNGIICSVKEAIEQDLYGNYLADPIEGTEYGTTTAQLIKRYGQPFIRSFAHGGRSYRISFQKAFNLFVLNAYPGYGKTRAIHHRVLKLYQDGEYICLVVPTKKLMSQYTQDLIQVGFGLNSIQAISSEDNSLSVGNQLGFAVKDNERLILITHACLKLMKPSQYKAMAHYHVFIDEVFDPLLSCQSYSLKDAVSDDGILKALCDWAPIESVYEAHVLRAKKSTTRQLSTQLSKQDGKHALSTKEINHVLAAAKDSIKQVIISKMNRSKKHNYCIAELYNCTHLKYFKSCTIASAFVQETALYHWCSLSFNMVDVTAEYSADFQDLSARMKQLTVMPFVDHYMLTPVEN